MGGEEEEQRQTYVVEFVEVVLMYKKLKVAVDFYEVNDKTHTRLREEQQQDKYNGKVLMYSTPVCYHF